MSKKKTDNNPFIEAFKKLPKDHTPADIGAIIKKILNEHGLLVEKVSIATSPKNSQGLGKGKPNKT